MYNLLFKILGICCLAGLIFYAAHAYEEIKKLKTESASEYNLLKDSNSMLLNEVQAAKDKVAIAEAGTITAQSDLAKNLQKQTSLKQFTNMTKANFSIHYDTISAKYVDSANKVFCTSTIAPIQLCGTIGTKGVKITKLNIPPINVQITLGKGKRDSTIFWLWRWATKRKNSVEMKFDNPYIKINKVESVNIDR